MRVKEGNKEKDIIESAIHVFAEKGFYNSRISEIADKANVAAGSVYLYFKNKDQILLKIMEIYWQKLLFHATFIPERKDINSIEKLDLLLDSIFELLSASPSITLVFIKELQNLSSADQKIISMYYDKFLDASANIIYSGQKEGLFNKKLNAVYLKNFIFGGTRYLLHQWALAPNEFPLKEVKKQVKSFIKKGLTAGE